MSATFKQDEINIRGRLNELECLPTAVAQNTQELLPLQAYTGRNLLFNGDFSIRQRGDSLVNAVSSYLNYGVDRWVDYYAGVTTSSSQEEIDGLIRDVHTSTLGATGDGLYITQKIEQGSIRLSGRKLSFSVYVKTSGMSSVRLVMGFASTGSNLSSNEIFVNDSISVEEDEWTRISVSGKGVDNLMSSSRIAYVQIVAATSTSGDSLSVADAQLEFGEVVTPPEFVPLVINLANCQRYYYRLTSEDVVHYLNTLQAYSTDGANGKLVSFPVPMRNSDIITSISSLNHLTASKANASLAGSPATMTLTGRKDGITVSNSTGFTDLVAGNAVTVYLNTVGAWIAGECEL